MAKIIIVLNVKYVILVSTLVNQLEYVVNAQRKTPRIYQMLHKVFGSFHNSTCFRNHLENDVCDNSKSCDICGQVHRSSA